MTAEACHDCLATTVVVVGEPTEGERDWDLDEQTDSSHSVSSQLPETEGANDGRGVGIESTLRTVVAHGDGEVSPHAPICERLLEGSEANLLLLPALSRFIEMDTSAEDMDLAVSEHLPLGQKRWVWPLERVGQEETQYKTGEDCEATHKHEEPEPSCFAADATHMQDTVG